MDVVQFVSVVGGIVLVLGLLRAHHVIVKRYVIPGLDVPEDDN